MKLKLNKQGFRNGSRRAFSALLFGACWLTLVAGQSVALKHISSVFTSTSASGSRVTIDADVPLNDYEAYRHADRYYVRIPLAGLPSKIGSLIGRGFDDGKVQRYGDGIMLSFHLLPGTTARADQRSDHLDIVFSVGGNVATPVATPEVASRTRTREVEDAGPAPDTTSYEAGRIRPYAGGSALAHSQARATASPATAASPSPNAAASPNPSPSTSPGPSPSSSSTPATKTASAASTPAASPATSSSSNTTTDWSTRMHYYSIWAQLNWIPLLIIGLVLIILVVLLLVWRKAKQEAAASRRAEENAAPRKVTTPRAQAQVPPNPRPVETASARSGSFNPIPKTTYAVGDQEREVFEI